MFTEARTLGHVLDLAGEADGGEQVEPAQVAHPRALGARVALQPDLSMSISINNINNINQYQNQSLASPWRPCGPTACSTTLAPLWDNACKTRARKHAARARARAHTHTHETRACPRGTPTSGSPATSPSLAVRAGIPCLDGFAAFCVAYQEPINHKRPPLS